VRERRVGGVVILRGWVDEDGEAMVYVASTINDVDEVVEGKMRLRFCTQAGCQPFGHSRLPEAALVA